MKKLKGYILSFILGALLFGGISVYASTSSIDVNYLIKDIIINGVSKMPNERPFVYKGTTYVPLRYISESLGYSVKWEGESKTIYIGEIAKEKRAYPGSTIEPINTQTGITGGIESVYLGSIIRDNLSNEYNSYIRFSGYIDKSIYTEFPVNGLYNKFTANFAITDKYKNTKASIIFRVYADDELIYSKSYKAGDMPEDINVDIKNAIKVKFEVLQDSMSESDFYEVALIKPVFTRE